MDEHKALASFSENNPDLDKLEDFINAFNPLKTLRIGNLEMSNGSVLAWLIDPNGHHGLGDTLLKNMLLEFSKHSIGNEPAQIKDVTGANFADLIVKKGWRNIGILAVSPQNKIVLAIENDGNGARLAKGVEAVREKYPDYEKAFALLTSDGTVCKGNGPFIPFTHRQILGMVRSTIELRKDYTHPKACGFVQEYLSVLEGKSMKTAELTDICGKLFREHGAAIRMILEYGKPWLPISNMREFHARTKTVSVHSEKSHVPVYYSFIPQTWSEAVPTTNIDKSDRYLIFFRFHFAEYKNHNVPFSIIIGRFPDPEERAQFVAQVSKAAETEKGGGLKVKSSSKAYTTIFSRSIALKDASGEGYRLDDYEAVTAKLAEVYNSPEVQRAFEIIDGVVQAFPFKDV